MRRSIRVTAIIVFAISPLGAPAAMAGQQARPPAPAAQAPSAPVSPYGDLFVVPRPKLQPPPMFAVPFGAERPVAALQREQPATKVTCGMTLIPADASSDPAMPHVPSPQRATRYTLRVSPPLICRP
jgi:hypothetical protein